MTTLKTEVPVDEDILELVPFFLQSRETDIKKLNSLLSDKNFVEIARISHTIKGIARPYGFPTLEHLARELEDACKKSEENLIRTQVQNIVNYMSAYPPN